MSLSPSIIPIANWRRIKAFSVPCAKTRTDFLTWPMEGLIAARLNLTAGLSIPKPKSVFYAAIRPNTLAVPSKAVFPTVTQIIIAVIKTPLPMSAWFAAKGIT